MPGEPKTTVRDGSRTRGKQFAIGPYTAEARPLGKGGMSTVYRATDGSGRTVAIKELVPHLRSDRKMVQRFRQEYEVVSRLKHPNVVSFLDFVGANDTFNIVMEYVEGVSLRDVLARARRLDPDLVAGLGHQLAVAIGAVHAEGVLHRDIKPGNVLLSGDGALKLTDFGIAHQEGTRMTATGMVLGSPAYMSPEQLAGQREAVTEQTDVYALGVVLYECIEGLDPLRVPRHEDLLAVLQRKRETEPRPLKRCDDEALKALLLQCLAVDPAARPAGMAEVAGRLAEIAERGAGSGKPAPSGRALGRRLVELASKPKAKGRGPAAKAAGKKGAAPRVRRSSNPTLARLRERRIVIWLTLAAAVLLAAAAFVFSDAITG